MEGLLITKKRFEIIDFKETLDLGYEEIINLSRQCKFSNCTHTNESHCSVKKAISHGTLSEQLFNSYYRDLNESQYVSKQSNKTKAIDYMKQLKLFQ